MSSALSCDAFLPPPDHLVATRRFTGIDALLLLMALIWGTNYAIVKHAFRFIDPQAFNAVRMIDCFGGVPRHHRGDTPAAGGATRGGVAGWHLLHAIAGHRARLDRPGGARNRRALSATRYTFMAGLAATSVANAALLAAAAPVLIGLGSAAIGEGRIGAGALGRRRALARRDLHRHRFRPERWRQHAARRSD